MKKKEIQQRLNKLWKLGKKDLDEILKEATSLAKKGEIQIKQASKKAEQNLEAMVLSLQREKLYYELGKSLTRSPKKKWTKNKTIDRLSIKIKNISRNIKKLQKK